LRIVGGKYKGRKITVGKNFTFRPTTDFAREGLFNILANHFDFREVHFLDLFSGTGSVGFEMHSRGCTKAELVDIDRSTVRHMNLVITEFGMEGIRTVCMDAFKYIQICRDQYEIIFADPPYTFKQLPLLPDRILNANLLRQDGWFILEHPRNYSFAGHMMFMNERQYGNIRFSLFAKNSEASGRLFL